MVTRILSLGASLVFCLLLACTALAEPAPPVWGTPTAKGIVISAQLATPQETLRVGGKVQIILRIKNTGTSEVYTYALETFPEMTSCFLFTADGKPLVPKATYPVDRAHEGSIMSLKPNDEKQLTIDLDMIYDLSRAGSYSFLWTRSEGLMEFYALSSSGMLRPHMRQEEVLALVGTTTSNLLTFTLLEK